MTYQSGRWNTEEPKQLSTGPEIVWIRKSVVLARSRPQLGTKRAHQLGSGGDMACTSTSKLECVPGRKNQARQPAITNVGIIETAADPRLKLLLLNGLDLNRFELFSWA